jgi:hypothetical protein
MNKTLRTRTFARRNIADLSSREARKRAAFAKLSTVTIKPLAACLPLLLAFCGCQTNRPSQYNELSALAPISEETCAGIVFNETSSLRPTSLPAARRFIASVAYKRKGHGMASPKKPTDNELANPIVKAIWGDCQKAAKESSADDPGSCINFVIWPSADNGKTPVQDPKIGAGWPYDYKSKDSFGPFKNPARTGDVPVSEKVYVFKYCDVPQLEAADPVGRLFKSPR